jgi:MFS family permease
LSILPLIANIAMAGGLMIFGATSTAANATSVQENAEATATPWLYFFLAFGAMVTLIGIISIFLIPKDSAKPNRSISFSQNLIYGFRPSIIKQHKDLYIALLSFMALNTAINAFMPYWTVYFQNPESEYGLGYYGDKFNLYLICLVSILLVSSIIVVIVGLFMDKIGKLKLLLPGIALACVGFLCMYFATEVWALIISGILMMSGYLIGTAVLGAVVRDETPKDQVGLFQGVRMIFAVMIAMIVGSYTSLAFFQLSGKTYTDASTGTTSAAPTKVMFLVSLGFMLIAVAPSIWLLIAKKKEAAVSPASPIENNK